MSFFGLVRCKYTHEWGLMRCAVQDSAAAVKTKMVRIERSQKRIIEARNMIDKASADDAECPLT